jgi:2'-5' RNA ligase
VDAAVYRGRVGERVVTAVVAAAFDAGGDEAVVRLMDRVGARTPPRHRPHVTLGAVRLPEDRLDEVTGVVAAVAAGAAPFRVELASAGIFVSTRPPTPTSRGVLWLAPRPDPALRGLQAAVDAALAGAGHERAFGDQVHPDHWVAHCTLATRLDPPALGRAVTALTSGFRPVRTRVAALATILVGGRGDVAHVPLTGASAPRPAASGSG